MKKLFNLIKFLSKLHIDIEEDGGVTLEIYGSSISFLKSGDIYFTSGDCLFMNTPKEEVSKVVQFEKEYAQCN